MSDHEADAKVVREEGQAAGSAVVSLGLARMQYVERKAKLVGRTRLLEDSQPSVEVVETLDRKLDSEEVAETLDPHSRMWARGGVEEAHES